MWLVTEVGACSVILVVPVDWVVPWPSTTAPAVDAPLPTVKVPGVLILPELSIVAVVAGVCRVVVPPPVTRAVEVREPEATTVTVPEPAGVAHVPSPRRKLEEEGVPVTVPIAVAEAIKPPLTAGKVSAVAVPATAKGEIVTSPEVLPNILIPPLVVVFAPRTIWGTAAVKVAAPPTVIVVPMVAVVPMFNAFAALIPPEVRIAPVTLEDVSRVDGKKVDALAPVPPKVKSVVAPAKAVKEVDAVVMDVVNAGLVIV